MGGGSRDDIASLIVLRPMAALFAAYAFTVAKPGDFARLRTPLLLLLALGAWMVIQLIPLPYGVWVALPGRAMIAANDQMVGLGNMWRPLSLSPSKTMNALGSLVVPLAGLLLYVIQSDADRRKILPLMLIVAMLSAALGIAQIASGGTGPLYLYQVTNAHDVVGLFSNRNHNAVFLATMLVIGGYLLGELRRQRLASSGAAILIAAACLMVLATLLVNGSRAGLFIGLIAIGLGVAIYLTSFKRDSDGHTRGGPVLTWAAVLGIVGASIAGATLFFIKAASFNRLVTLSLAEESRAQTLPQIITMAKGNWVFGTGFGSFEHVYRVYESSQTLGSEYLNNAHNDWLQWIIEGGLPAILIAGAFGLWVAQVALEHWRSRLISGPRTQMAVLALAVLLLLLLASALDYPLRVPSMMLYAVLMVALFGQTPEPAARLSRRPGGGRG